MSDVMLFGVLRMPFGMAMSSELSRFQFWQVAREAADEIERLRALSAQPPAFVDHPCTPTGFVDHEAENVSDNAQPTAPSVPPVRERLTETQIDSASPLRIESAHWFKLGARWAERALIGGEG